MTSKFMGAFLICFSFFVHASASGSGEGRDDLDEGVAAVEETDAPALTDLGAEQLSVKTDGQAPVLVKDTVVRKGDKNIFKPSEAISEDFAAPLPTDI